MNTQVVKQTHPLVIIAAIAVTLFCLVGIGAVLGWFPTTRSQTAATPVAAPVAPTLDQAPAKIGQPKTETRPASVETRPMTGATHSKPKSKAVEKTAPAAEIAPMAKAEPPVQVAQANPPAPPAEPARKLCHDCGVIESVREFDKPGEASGLGAVGGAVVGGIVGNQVGGGRGRDLMTLLGAVGGGIAGHQVEKNARKTREYQTTIRFEDGSTRVIPQDTPPSWRPGDKVKVVDGMIQPNG